MAFGFDTALSALSATRVALNTVGHNIANASTRGYSRQRVNFAPAAPELLRPGLAIGRGVGAASIQRMSDDFVGARLRNQYGEHGRASAEKEVYDQLERAWGEPGPFGLSGALNGFFNGVRNFAYSPGETASQTTLLQKAKDLSQTFQSSRAALRDVRVGVTDAIHNAVDSVNRVARELAALNRTVTTAGFGGEIPADIRDAQDRLLGELGAFVDVSVSFTATGAAVVTSAGQLLVDPNGANQVKLLKASGPGQTSRLRVGGATVDFQPRTGKLRGLLDLDPSLVQDQTRALDDAARQLIAQVNHAHATGVPPDGGYTALTGLHPLKDLDGDGKVRDQLLNDSGLPFPIRDGVLTVSITQDADGTTQQVRIPILSGATSVGEVVSALDAAPNLQATIDASGRLRVVAEPGYRFDFSPRVNNRPDPTGAFGAPVVAGGRFEGSSDRRFTLTALGAGQIGVTPGLQVSIESPPGTSLGVLDVGLGYAPGDPLELPDGLTVAFGPGAVDPLTSAPVAIDGIVDGDASRSLVALGMNALFAGSDAASIDVNPELFRNPNLLAAGLSGGDSDADNLILLAAAEGYRIDGLTVTERIDRLVGDSGFSAARANTAVSTQELLVEALENRRAQASGVSLDEELVALEEYQKTYEVVAKFTQTLSEVTDVLINLGR